MCDKVSGGLRRRHCTPVSVTTACCAGLPAVLRYTLLMQLLALDLCRKHRLIASPPPDHTDTLLLILFMAIALARTGH